MPLPPTAGWIGRLGGRFAVAKKAQAVPLGRTRTNIAAGNLPPIYKSISTPIDHSFAASWRVARVQWKGPMTKKKRKTVTTLEPRDCRWPVGDPRQADFHFCGEPQVPGQSYCGAHLRLAFQPPKPRHQQSVPRIPVAQAA
jgi:hypothetical protein